MGQTVDGPMRGWGLITGWGTGLESLPSQVPATMRQHTILPVPTPTNPNERLRRATRECLMGVAVVQAALDAAHLLPRDIAGPGTALVYASASSYTAANWSFVTQTTEHALHFPYTAPSAVPAEVTIQFGITGPYLTLLSGANAGIEALWQATTLLATAQCERAVVLGVETFQDCPELFRAGRWLLGTPLVETAACLILERSAGLTPVGYHSAGGPNGLTQVLQSAGPHPPGNICVCAPTAAAGQAAGHTLHAYWPGSTTVLLHERCGFMLACAPLVALMLARDAGQTADLVLLSQWWEAWALLCWPGTVGPGAALASTG